MKINEHFSVDADNSEFEWVWIDVAGHGSVRIDVSREALCVEVYREGAPSDDDSEPVFSHSVNFDSLAPLSKGEDEE